MAHAERRDLYLRPALITPDYTKEEPDEETKRPRLTLRYLHELIEDIHAENGKLADQIDTLSTQLDELARKLDALDIWKEDDELAAGLEVRFAYAESDEPAIAGDAGIADHADAVAAPEARSAAASHGVIEAGETEAATKQEAIESTSDYAPMEAITMTETAASSETALALQEPAGGSEAFAREWSLVALEDAGSSNGVIPHAAGELPASLQERMIENVKEAARIAEEIAAQASAYAEARADHEEDRADQDAASRMEVTFHATARTDMRTAMPAVQTLDAWTDLPTGEAVAVAEEPLSTDAVNEPHVAAASMILAQPPERRVRETVFRHESASAAHSYIPPRSERHAGSKKRSIWSRLFARGSL